ncbi:MAG: hypothetical protein KDA25_03730 [Phycisphaerales bacterium]|nr:hypothetical protein [Phycisphaerales bacterium]
MHIGLTFDLREDYLALGWSEQAVAEFDRADTIDALEGALRALGHEVDRIGNVHALMARLVRGDRWSLVFNIAESHGGVGRESLIPALLDAHGVPYTFADPLVCAMTLDKAVAKRILRDLGLPTPDFAVVADAADVETVDLPFPVFVKPIREGSSMGIGPDSIVHDADALAEVCRALIAEFDQPALVETYLPGAEVTVGIVGTGADAEVVGVLKVTLLPGATTGVYGYATKESCETLVHYELATGRLGREASRLALRVYRAFGCRDAGRVDLRADRAGRLQVIEVNPLAGLHPSHSDLPIICTLAGVSYETLIDRIVTSAARRAGAEVAACAS